MIWIIGGTKDSRILLEKLVEYTNDIIVSIMTQYGKKLLLDYPVKTINKRLTLEEKKELIAKYKIDIIIDASHPYAKNVSYSMMDIAKQCNIEYLRFERPALKYEGAKSFEDIESLVKYINTFCKDGNILSTLGSNNLQELNQIENSSRLFIRLLPVVDSLKKAESFGFLAKNIIAMQGPFSQEFNKAMIENYDIKYLLTKESGKEGGELEKILAAKQCDVELIVLKRPVLDYSKVVDSIDDVIQFIKNKR